MAVLAAAGPEDISFAANDKALGEARDSRAGVLFVSPKMELAGRARIVVAEVWAAVATAADEALPQPLPRPASTRTASVARRAAVHATASVGPYCVVGERAEIGEGAILGPHCIVDRDLRGLGAATRLVARA